ncbi:hypothetical protein [Leptolyngbya ohadii]|uniref:hypothetical protein n=1 Tax=Leptolyngbya ohadii TaxID=1962290 RepID=UPI000B5A1744|nr:hypothetical protein [Leptolyngbya ohadii]
MAIFRQYIAPLIVVFIFFVALVAVSARIFLPEDLAAPAPIEEVRPEGTAVTKTSDATMTAPVIGHGVADLPPSLETLVHGFPAADGAM